MQERFTGLYAATFSPMHEDGSLNLDPVGPIVEYLIENGVEGLFVCGTTGEGPSLANDERRRLAAAYTAAAAGRIKTIVHVGQNSLAEARELAAHAQEIGADAVAATPPSYHKPATMEALVASMAEVAAGAPELPFFFYNIPLMTGVDFQMPDFMRAASERIPTLAGLKHTKPTLAEVQGCLELEEGRFNVMFGGDEMLLGALAVGVKGAVGSTYNLVPRLYRGVIDAFEAGDIARARELQSVAVGMIRTIQRLGGLPPQKAMMKIAGFDCGPVRLPLVAISESETQALQRELDENGVLEWLGAEGVATGAE